MKKLIKIKSITDVITNSSSEVYVVSEGTAKYYADLPDTNDCIWYYKIDWDWVKKEGIYEYEMICEICDIDKKILEDNLSIQNGYVFSPGPTKEDWETFIEMFYDIIEEKLIKPNYCFLEIEDHFEDSYEVSRSARYDSIWVEWRH